jgi:hypothetical protein
MLYRKTSSQNRVEVFLCPYLNETVLIRLGEYFFKHILLIEINSYFCSVNMYYTK